MDKRLVSLEVENFRSLRKVHLPLGDLTVLVGPNGAGKTNVLKVFEFLADIIRTDLEPAINARGGFDEIVFHGGDKPPRSIRIAATATWTTHSSRTAPDEYELRITRSRRASGDVLSRREAFQFKRTKGRGRRITISGQQATVVSTGDTARTEDSIGIRSFSSGLSTLPRLHGGGGDEVAAVADRLASFRVFDVAVAAARRPARPPRHHVFLEDDASNLAAFLSVLRRSDEQAFDQLQDDAQQALPQLEAIDFERVSDGTGEIAVVLHERGLRRPTPLVDASYGTVRLLGLLALLYDPRPPALTCIEEIDHGLHPQALEMLVERLREASERSQFLIATHSPALADRLRPEEFVVCERRDDGSSAIPAVSTAEVERIVAASEGLPLGELWFSGALGGDL
ncbi:AAA family ATPase [Saccharothrix yanglingensis]|uniref:ATPase n=1 Tax=Saccharothrix yanglingensis TaxID=659496 RepID=A0ABU0X1D7_9PSEU|nr:AAA family ATPase [Saccharothrix yanglingensis]MDQ2585946.1 ATPase [Saccharothrix yanglingensis]